jgi:hypothetical protein
MRRMAKHKIGALVMIIFCTILTSSCGQYSDLYTPSTTNINSEMDTNINSEIDRI